MQCSLCGEMSRGFVGPIPLCLDCIEQWEADTAPEPEPEIAETLPAADGVRKRGLSLPFSNIPES